MAIVGTYINVEVGSMNRVVPVIIGIRIEGVEAVEDGLLVNMVVERTIFNFTEGFILVFYVGIRTGISWNKGTTTS